MIERRETISTTVTVMNVPAALTEPPVALRKTVGGAIGFRCCMCEVGAGLRVPNCSGFLVGANVPDLPLSASRAAVAAGLFV